MIDEQFEQLVQKAAKDLGEYFDNVQIHVNWMREGQEKVASYEFGVGNIHARISHCREWVIIQDEYARIYAQKRSEEP